MALIMKSSYLILGILGCIVLVVTGHMDLDWQLVCYYFDSVQNSWGYWEYCPGVRINWWVSYFIQVIRIAVGWLGLGWLLNEVKHCLAHQ